MTDGDRPFLPWQAPIDAYGRGGFRFAEMSHRGSILALPSGIHAWPVANFDELTENDFTAVFEEAEKIEFLLLGCGTQLRRPGEAVRAAFRAHRIGIDPMDTGAAARTYNICLEERRAVAAALIAVADPVDTR